MSDVQPEIKTDATPQPAAEEIVVSTELKNIIESLIFASDEPMTVRFIRSIMDDVNKDLPPAQHYSVNADIIRKAVGDLNRGYGRMGSGFRIIEVAGGFTYATLENFSSWVGKLAKEKARRRLSPTAVETLAIIAYKQPIAKGEVEFIRGVNVDYIINALLEKDLIHITGRANTPGRPLLYGTTQKFLEHFGLNDLTDLPKPREISELINETELEVDRRLLAEQQELEFKEDLEKKLDGNEGAKNKPQRGAKMKVPDEVKEENRKEAKQKEIPPADGQKIEEGVGSSKSNSAVDETAAAGTADQAEAAALLENGPELRATSEQDPSATNEPVLSETDGQENPADSDENRQIDLRDLTVMKEGVLSEGREPAEEAAHSDQTAPEAVMTDVPADSPTGEKENRITGVPSHSTTDVQENPEAVSEEQEHPYENHPTTSTDAAVDRSAALTAEGHPAPADLEETEEEAFVRAELEGREQPQEEPGQSGWSKWKTKVKTFFRKLFA
jgi:segregation and condensation protein B